MSLPLLALAFFASLGDGASAKSAAPVSASLSGPTVIKLRDRAIVRGSELRIGDVAECSGPRAAEVGALRLGYAPAPGIERRLLATTVAARATDAGFARSDVRLEGAGCVVTVETILFDARDVAACVQGALALRLDASSKLDISGAPELRVARPRDNDAVVTLEAEIPAAEPRGNVSTRVHAICRGERLGTAIVPITVRREVEAFVAKDRLAVGDAADVHRFELRKVDVTHVIGTPVADPIALVGRQCARVLSPGSVLLAEDLRQAPLYRKGETTRLTVIRGALRIDCLVRLEADAAPGARVAVTNLSLDQPKSILAHVKEDGSLELASDAGKENR